jgi:hypothetical protein
MEQTIEYLNETRGAARFYAVEVVRFGADGIQAFEARTVIKPAARGTTGGGTPPDATSEGAFLDAVSDEAYRTVLREFFEVCRGLKLRSEWGTSGASFRLPTPDRTEPLTVAWVFQAAGPGWMGLRGLNLGYAAASARNTPSVAPALEQYTDAVSALHGAVAVTSAGLRAYQIPPATVVEQQGRIAEILAALVQQDPEDGANAASALESRAAGEHDL